MAASSSWPALGEMTEKSKKVGESGKDSPDKSPPSGGESELAAALSSKEQSLSDRNAGGGDGADLDQQKGKKKGGLKFLLRCSKHLVRTRKLVLILHECMYVCCFYCAAVARCVSVGDGGCILVIH